MNNKCHWTAFFCTYVIYLIIGGTIFYMVESKQEVLRKLNELNQKNEIKGLIENYYKPDGNHSQAELYYKISSYCNKPLGEFESSNITYWTFFHSVFFVLAILCTLGNGNLVPSTTFTRVFIIIYGIIGIPMNGIVIIKLGEFFRNTFLKIHRRWKTQKVDHILVTIGLPGQLILYFITGFIFFITIPSFIIFSFEDWSYEYVIEFTFATLTTIGGGRLIPATNQKNSNNFVFALYKCFLFVWIIIGLGYIAMVFGFISSGFKSKKIIALEEAIANNIKKTNHLIRRELRLLLNEYLVVRVKPVYRERRINVLTLKRTQSCPDLKFCKESCMNALKSRALSVPAKYEITPLNRVHSDTNLERIDRIKTFENDINNEHSKFILKMAHALGNFEDVDFSDIKSEKLVGKTGMRLRSASESTTKVQKFKNLNTYGAQMLELKHTQKIREENKYSRLRSHTWSSIDKTQDVAKNIKNTLKTNKCDQRILPTDVESQNYADNQAVHPKELPRDDKSSEDNALSDFLRALTIINFSEISRSRPKFYTHRVRRAPITSSLETRKMSLIPSVSMESHTKRRYSENNITCDRKNCNSKLVTIKECRIQHK